MIELTSQERASPLWQKLHAHFEEKLAALRKQNDAPLDPVKTAGVRAEIAVYKALSSLDK